MNKYYLLFCLCAIGLVAAALIQPYQIEWNAYPYSTNSTFWNSTALWANYTNLCLGNTCYSSWASIIPANVAYLNQTNAGSVTAYNVTSEDSIAYAVNFTREDSFGIYILDAPVGNCTMIGYTEGFNFTGVCD